MALSEAEMNELFELMKANFNAEKAENIDTIVQFNLTGDKDEYFYVHIHDQKADVNQGQTDDANTTFTAVAEDYADIVHGRTNAMQAFMQGKLKVQGDMGLAMKLQSIFGL